jgi:hypothetical protein
LINAFRPTKSGKIDILWQHEQKIGSGVNIVSDRGMVYANDYVDGSLHLVVRDLLTGEELLRIPTPATRASIGSVVFTENGDVYMAANEPGQPTGFLVRIHNSDHTKGDEKSDLTRRETKKLQPEVAPGNDRRMPNAASLIKRFVESNMANKNQDSDAPHQPTPSPEQAPLLFSMLDQDGDKKVSRDEAKGSLKTNFAFVDSDGDGGIDLEEFTRVLQLASGQRASRGAGTQATTAANLAEPSYGTRNEKQWARMLSLPPDEDGEFLMVNLIKYRAKAKYADGRKTDLTGEQADALYAPIEFLGQIGARVDYAGRVKDQMGNVKPRWDQVGVVRYPSRAKFFEMVTNPEFQKRAVHKDAGLEVSQVLLTEPVPWPLSGAKQVADKDDAFTLAQLLKYRETAEYADGTV